MSPGLQSRDKMSPVGTKWHLEVTKCHIQGQNVTCEKKGQNVNCSKFKNKWLFNILEENWDTHVTSLCPDTLLCPHTFMQVFGIHGCRKRKTLLSINARKGIFSYPWMQERIVFAIPGSWEGKFLLSMDAGKDWFCYPWMQERIIPNIHGRWKKKCLLFLVERSDSFCYHGCRNHGCRNSPFLPPWIAETSLCCIRG